MSRRARAVSFLVAACLCAVIAASLASGYGDRIERQYGVLRPVVVAGTELRPGKVIGPGAANHLQLRRVPARFVPPDAIADPNEAVGREPAALVPAGSYVLASQLRMPKEGKGAESDLAAGRSPVEISVAGGQALAAAGSLAEGRRVDVVVTTEPKGAGSGRTYVAADDVELLDLRQAEDGAAEAATGATGGWVATLALNHDEALRLIAAENFARQVRLLPLPEPTPGITKR